MDRALCVITSQAAVLPPSKSRVFYIAAGLLALVTVGCSEAPRSYQYFQDHQDEARAVDAACTRDEKRGEECTNAAGAIPHPLIVRGRH